ncbi:MAG: hypothetical protein IFNCLDLE_02044 [Ignavibacteriaceae bacterium]|nr:hypothetical protein [Ignavibacteriaceae bacterium]
MNSAEFKYIRLDYLDELTGGDEEIMEEMLKLFLENTPVSLKNLGELCTQKNYEELKKAAHKFKPTLSYVGILELEGVVPEIEKLAGEADPEGKIPELLKELAFYCEKGVQEISSYFNKKQE